MMKVIDLKENIEKEFTRRLVERFEPIIERVIFFGSRAQGKAKPWSDYDLLIVLDKREPQTIDEIYELVTEFQLNYRVDISLKIYGKDDFERKNALQIPFFNRIQKTGIILWNRYQKNLSEAK